MTVNRTYITPEMEQWAMDNQCVITDGEIGFGRPCVGLIRDTNYVDWHPEYRGKTPEDAYHKHDCVAVLVRGGLYDEAWRQLAEWLANIIDAGHQVEMIPTGATGLQVLFSGVEAPTLTKVNQS